MTKKNYEEASEIVAVGIAKIVNDYTDNALLINSCYVAIDRYETKQDTTHLSTTQNIPPALRLDNEIEVRLSNKDLVKKYSSDVQRLVCRNYIITIVATVDAVLEDLFEYLLRVIHPQVTDIEVDKLVRNAWTNDGMLNFLSDPNGMNLQKPAALNMEFKEAFLRYGELRIIRHTLLHTEGILSEKNYQKLQENVAVTPNERKHFALLNGPIIDNNRRIVLSINIMLAIRQYLDRFLMYVFKALVEKVT